MSLWIIWTILAGAFIIAEMMTATFYFLLLGLGLLAAAALAYLGFELWLHFIAAAIVIFVGWIVVRQFRPQILNPDARANPDMNIDIGTVVRLSEIHPNGKVLTNYRGAQWEVEILDGSSPQMDRDYIIHAVNGAKLVLTQKGV
jgi:membrane protein implicated in regulation of membrane protease activity